MDTDKTPRKPPSTATESAARNVGEHRSALRALLRLINPESPFQPILLSSIDIVSWLALFGRAAQQFGESLRGIPDAKCRNAALEANEPFLRIAYALCQYAEFHAFPTEGRDLEDVPEIASLSPESAICQEDSVTIAAALNEAYGVFEASTTHRQLLAKTLALAATKLKKQVNGPGGLLQLMKRRCRSSRPFRRQYAHLTNKLTAALVSLPDPKATPWDKCRIRFSDVRYQLETDLLPQLGAIIKELCGPPSAEAKKPESLKTTTLRAVTAFIESQGLARSLDTGLLAVQYHTLFHGVLAPVNASLRRCRDFTDIPSESPRVIDDIRRLAPEVIKKDVLASWDSSLSETDPYTTEVVLAAIHHLERPPEDVDGSTAKGRSGYGISDADLTRWVRRGTYIGADPRAETSTNSVAETKRIDRTLQHLRRVGAAFHDRRQWTPTHIRNAESTQHRLWTINPLLVLLPRIAARLGNGTSSAEGSTASSSPGSRPRPTRRNRGTRPRAKG